MFLIFGSPNQIVNSRRAGARGGTLSARKVQTRNACFHQLRARTVPVQIWGAEHKIKNDPKQVVVYFGSPNQIRTGVLALKGRCPRPLDDGAKTATFLLETPPNYNRHLCLCQGFYAGYFYSFIQLVLVLLLQVL